MKINKLFLLSALGFVVSASVLARTDMEARDTYLKALTRNHESEMDHSAHIQPDPSQDFHGIFYGYIPCHDCNGIKVTLSLKQKNNYLLVTQPARESSKEYYEKGKYVWDEANRIVTLTPRKQGEVREYRIKDDNTLIQLQDNGKAIDSDQADAYSLRRSDSVQSREVHIH